MKIIIIIIGYYFPTIVHLYLLSTSTPAVVELVEWRPEGTEVAGSNPGIDSCC